MSETAGIDNATKEAIRQLAKNNSGISACADLLYEHLSNDGNIPLDAQAFIVLPVGIREGLLNAIQCCVRSSSIILEQQFDEHDVTWADEWAPEVRESAEQVEQLKAQWRQEAAK